MTSLFPRSKIIKLYLNLLTSIFFKCTQILALIPALKHFALLNLVNIVTKFSKNSDEILINQV